MLCCPNLCPVKSTYPMLLSKPLNYRLSEYCSRFFDQSTKEFLLPFSVYSLEVKKKYSFALFEGKYAVSLIQLPLILYNQQSGDSAADNKHNPHHRTDLHLCNKLLCPIQLFHRGNGLYYLLSHQSSKEWFCRRGEAFILYTLHEWCV